MQHERIKSKLITWPIIVLALLIAIGAVAVYLRMSQGLGATTNMSDQWPWGLWKGFNVLCLIALGAGGFTSAALIYIFGGERYHEFARPTALWGLLCYSFAGASLMVDIAIPWRIINIIWMWPEHSILFEVGWCVMLYITVLGLEVLPGVFERFGWEGLQSKWKVVVPAYSVLGLTFFTYIMSHSVLWAAAALVFFGFLATALPRVGKEPSTPVLLIMFGVILSTLHQSSLGSLFLLMPDKLSHYWWSPRLPFNFILSAITIGFAMLILERTITSKLFGREVPNEKLAGLSKVVVAFLWGYIAFRLADVLVQFGSVADFGGVAGAFGGPGKGGLFVVELFVGFMVPAMILTWEKGRETGWLRIVAVCLIIFGVMFNRLNTTFIGMMGPGEYIPSVIEFLISIATLSAIVLLFTLGVKSLPIYPKVEETA